MDIAGCWLKHDVSLNQIIFGSYKKSMQFYHRTINALIDSTGSNVFNNKIDNCFFKKIWTSLDVGYYYVYRRTRNKSLVSLTCATLGS